MTFHHLLIFWLMQKTSHNRVVYFWPNLIYYIFNFETLLNPILLEVSFRGLGLDHLKMSATIFPEILKYYFFSKLQRGYK
jgi:hypothetical protein